MPDVDIDFFDRDNTLKFFKHTPASIIKDGKSEKHKTGVYFHAVPEHPVTGHASLDYKDAEDRGYPHGNQHIDGGFFGTKSRIMGKKGKEWNFNAGMVKNSGRCKEQA